MWDRKYMGGEKMGVHQKVYDGLVRKNENVQKEYERYVMEHTVEHYESRFKHWKILWKLNWHYRVKKKNEPMLYFDGDNKKGLVKQKKNPQVESKISNEKKLSEKMPYLEGAESELFMRKAPHYACRTLMEYDIISFDIFDTLVFRPFCKPADLFMILGEKFGILNFQEIRVSAEKKAREQHNVLYGNTEIVIDDIYEIIETMTGIPKQVGIQTEFECEMEFIRPNPYCKRLFELLKAQGKRMIACSDMYFSKKYMESILAKCGYIGFEEIYVSCDFTFSKRNKGMYKMLINKYGSDCNLVHMGDNFAVDVTAARECGLNAIFSKNCNIAGMKYRAENMSPLIGSAYAGIVNMHLHNGLKSYSPYYEFGYVYGGIYVLGYCNWIYKHAKQHNITRILFLSRDGYIYKKVFEKLFPDIKTEYVYWSRVAGQKYTMEKDFNDFITKMLVHKINNPNVHDTLGDLFKILDIEVMLPKLAGYKLVKEEEIAETNKELLIRFFAENKKEIMKHYEKQKAYLKELFKYHIGDAQNISIVDVGWIGSGPLGLKYLINDVWKMKCNVYCLVAANRHYSDKANAVCIAEEEVESYLFNSSLNVSLLQYHALANKNTNNLFFEQFTQAPEPSFEGINDELEFMFDLPEVENYEKINEIHKGIYEFATEYAEIFKNCSYMLNISGHDAYMPFKLITKNLKFIKKYLGDMTYARSVGSNKKDQKIDTLYSVLENLGL